MVTVKGLTMRLGRPLLVRCLRMTGGEGLSDNLPLKRARISKGFCAPSQADSDSATSTVKDIASDKDTDSDSDANTDTETDTGTDTTTDTDKQKSDDTDENNGRDTDEQVSTEGGEAARDNMESSSSVPDDSSPGHQVCQAGKRCWTGAHCAFRLIKEVRQEGLGELFNRTRTKSEKIIREEHKNVFL